VNQQGGRLVGPMRQDPDLDLLHICHNIHYAHLGCDGREGPETGWSRLPGVPSRPQILSYTSR
jgi:hypothetical protein